MAQIVVTTFVKNLLGGGAERVAVNLLQGLPQDVFTQELVMVEAWGTFLEQVPEHVKRIDLGSSGGTKEQGNVTAAIAPLVRYLRERKPDILISHLAHANVAAVIAAACARTGTKVILVEHNDNTLLDQARTRSKLSSLMQRFKSLTYNRADAIIGVSEGVSRYVSRTFMVPETKMQTIYNPVVSERMLACSHEPLLHPWFAPDALPVLLASGRLREQKDFSTLLRAFALVRQSRPCRLLILGEGELRPDLEAEVAALGLQDSVLLPGFVDNPYPYMRAAALFVLSSRWEGLPTVLVEAMACGCPVVATDCPSGPAEILEDGEYGQLAPMADPNALAGAILAELAAPTPSEQLEARAACFSFENAIASYTNLLISKAAQPGRQNAAKGPSAASLITSAMNRAGTTGQRALHPRKAEEQKHRSKWS